MTKAIQKKRVKMKKSLHSKSKSSVIIKFNSSRKRKTMNRLMLMMLWLKCLVVHKTIKKQLFLTLVMKKNNSSKKREEVKNNKNLHQAQMMTHSLSKHALNKKQQLKKKLIVFVQNKLRKNVRWMLRVVKKNG